MLQGRLELHDIHDVEGFCTTIANGRLRQYAPWRQEDLIAYLITEAWELSTRYTPESTIPFSTYVGITLRKRIIDWIRRNITDDRYPESHRTTTYDPMDPPITISTMGDPTDNPTDHLRIHPQRDSPPPRPYPNRTRRPTPTTTR